MENKFFRATEEVINFIDFKGNVKEVRPFGNGYINDTFLITCTLEDGNEEKYILQKINNSIFKDIDKLMKNYCEICDYLKTVVKENGGDLDRETITVIPSKSEKSYVKDSKGNYWRAIKFIKDTIAYDVIRSPEDFYKTGKVFGEFQNMLSGYDAKKLYETIPNFHNTVERYRRFIEAINNNKSCRYENAIKEVNFITSRRADTEILLGMLEQGILPLRVTHNDAKINNVLMDKDTKEGICIIDLDTVMPGLVAYDFGDAIRSGATYATEDEKDLNKVYIDLELFEVFTKGFIEGAGSTLTKEEIIMLPLGAKIITLEQGIRFLTDYLDGDLYYKTSYLEQNLDRARTQLKLVSDMEKKWDKIVKIIDKYI